MPKQSTGKKQVALAARLEEAAQIWGQVAPWAPYGPKTREARQARSRRTRAGALLGTHQLLEDDRQTVKVGALAARLAELRQPRRWRVFGNLTIATFVEVEATTEAQAREVARGRSGGSFVPVDYQAPEVLS